MVATENAVWVTGLGEDASGNGRELTNPTSLKGAAPAVGTTDVELRYGLPAPAAGMEDTGGVSSEGGAASNKLFEVWFTTSLFGAGFTNDLASALLSGRELDEAAGQRLSTPSFLPLELGLMTSLFDKGLDGVGGSMPPS